MQVSAESQPRELRRTVTPYVGQSIIFLGITVFCLAVAGRKSQWTLLIAPMLIWILYGGLLWFGLKYRVFWDSKSVYQRASGLKEKRITFNQITEIRIEQAPISSFLAMSRPFRRVAIYGLRRDADAFIDISLRHFRLEDIVTLLKVIGECRPDLKVPRDLNL